MILTNALMAILGIIALVVAWKYVLPIIFAPLIVFGWLVGLVAKLAVLAIVIAVGYYYFGKKKSGKTAG